MYKLIAFGVIILIIAIFVVVEWLTEHWVPCPQCGSRRCWKTVRHCQGPDAEDIEVYNCHTCGARTEKLGGYCA